MGKWQTVEAKVNRKPKASDKKKKHQEETFLDDAEQAYYQGSGYENIGRSSGIATSSNTFATMSQVQARKEAEHQQNKEATRRAKEESAKKKAEQRAVFERRKAAADRARREQDPTTWPILSESLAQNKAAITEGFKELSADVATMSKPSLRLHYVLGILSQHTPKALDWPVDEDYNDNKFNLPLGPVLDDAAAVEVLKLAMAKTHANGKDITGQAVINVLTTYFGAKGTKKAEVGEGSAARLYVQLLLHKYRTQVLEDFEALQAIFLDAKTGKFFSKISFYNFCFVMYQLVNDCSGDAGMSFETTLAVVDSAATGFINSLGNTDWYESDETAVECTEAVLTSILESAGNFPEDAAEGQKPAPRKLDGTAAATALAQAGDDINSIVNKVLVSRTLRNTEAYANVFTAVLNAQQEGALDSEVSLPFMTILLTAQPKLFSKWTLRVTDAPIGTANLLVFLVSQRVVIDEGFATQATNRLRNVQNQKKISENVATACEEALKALGAAKIVSTASLAKTSVKSTKKGATGVTANSSSAGSAVEHDDGHDAPFVVRFLITAVIVGVVALFASGKADTVLARFA